MIYGTKYCDGWSMVQRDNGNRGYRLKNRTLFCLMHKVSTYALLVSSFIGRKVSIHHTSIASPQPWLLITWIAANVLKAWINTVLLKTCNYVCIFQIRIPWCSFQYLANLQKIKLSLKHSLFSYYFFIFKMSSSWHGVWIWSPWLPVQWRVWGGIKDLPWLCL